MIRRTIKKVDRRLGDNEDFKEFVKKCHEAGIRVVVDGVFNHTGREFFAFQDIQKNREHSPYVNWYKGVNFGWNSPYNDGLDMSLEKLLRTGQSEPLRTGCERLPF